MIANQHTRGREMKIDIRGNKEDEVDEIQFADIGSRNKAFVIKRDDSERLINIVGFSDHIHTRVMKGDIDNLIKALEMAKELWGGE